MVSIVETAPAKLLLFGEHAAVYGYPSVGISLPWELQVSLEDSEQWQWDNLKVSTDQVRLQQLLDMVKYEFPSVSPSKICVESKIPIGVGFGSSGALCVALSKAIDKKIDSKFTLHQVWSLAHKFENTFHFKSSGIDTGIATFRGLCGFHGSPIQMKEINHSIKMTLVIGAVPRDQNTASLVKMIHQNKDIDPNINEYLQKLGKIAMKVQDEPLSAYQLGELANFSQHYLRQLGLSNQLHDIIFDKALERGALGAKLSGAGGGGAYFIVTESNDQAHVLIEEIKQLDVEHTLSPIQITL